MKASYRVSRNFISKKVNKIRNDKIKLNLDSKANPMISKWKMNKEKKNNEK